MMLSILIPTLTSRGHFYNRLHSQLSKLIAESPFKDEIEIIPLCDNRELTIGDKRNKLLEMATGEYSVFVDDDDLVDGNYIKLIMQVLPDGFDGIGFKGLIFTDGKNPKSFIHKVGETYREQGGIYYRPLNHLNPIKTSIMRKIGFPSLNHAEDFDFSNRLAESGLIKTTYFIDAHLYMYYFRSKKQELINVPHHRNPA